MVRPADYWACPCQYRNTFDVQFSCSLIPSSSTDVPVTRTCSVIRKEARADNEKKDSAVHQ